MGKRDLVSLPSLSSWCLVIVAWLFLAVPWVCMQFVIVVFPDRTYLLIWISLHFFRKELLIPKIRFSAFCDVIYCKSYLFVLHASVVPESSLQLVVEVNALTSLS